MCIGIPMKIIEQREYAALCRGRNGERMVATLLIGPQPAGTWILDFLGTAREVLSPQEAGRIDAALDALDALMRGDKRLDMDAHFKDLMAPGRPPGGLIPGKVGKLDW